MKGSDGRSVTRHRREEVGQSVASSSGTRRVDGGAGEGLGFIRKHPLLQLLQRGRSVTDTLRRNRTNQKMFKSK